MKFTISNFIKKNTATREGYGRSVDQSLRFVLPLRKRVVFVWRCAEAGGRVNEERSKIVLVALFIITVHKKIKKTVGFTGSTPQELSNRLDPTRNLS